MNKIYHILQVGQNVENCIIAKCPESSETVIFDPGAEPDKIIEYLKKISASPNLILNTHAHYDHIGAVEELKKYFGIEFWIHKNEQEYLSDPSKNYSTMFGCNVKLTADRLLEDNDIIKVGNLEYRLLFTPGHTKGSCCYYQDKTLIAGDTIFAGSIGRTDLYGGDTDTILRSIKNKILPLDLDTLIIPGHGRNTTLKEEKLFNPFLD